MSNGKAYKGKYVYSSDGNLQFEKVGGGTIISAGGSGIVGDLTGSGNKTVPLVKKEDEMAGVAEAQALAKKQAAAKAKADAEKAQQKRDAEAYQKQLADKERQTRLKKAAKEAAEARARQRQAEIDRARADAREAERDAARAAQREADKKAREERVGRGSGTGRRGGQGIVRTNWLR